MPRPASHDRDKALDAAMALFWAKGFQGTSLKDLETALNMRPGSIYAAFESKETLFRATLERYAERMRQDLSELLERSPSPLAALQAHLMTIAAPQDCAQPSTACMLVKTLLEVPGEGPVRSAVLTHLETVESMLAEAFEQAKAKGEIPADCDTGRMARRIQTYIFGLKIQAQRQVDPDAMRMLCSDLAAEIGALRQPR